MKTRAPKAIMATKRSAADTEGEMSDRPLIHVTDHAIVRWLERVQRMDIASLRVALGRAGAPALQHDVKVIVLGGGSIIVEGDKVVTAISNDMRTPDLDAMARFEPVETIQGLQPMRRRKWRRG